MNLSELNALRVEVLWAAFAVALAFGVLVQRTQFCTMGAFSDVVNLGAWTRMKMWALAVGVAMVGFNTLGWLGLIDVRSTIYAGEQVLWLSALVGGGLFGFGMVLASGCGSKTLVRAGAGSLKAVVVFAVMGLTAYATLSGVLAVVRVNTVERVFFNMAGGGTLPLWVAARWGLEPGATGLMFAMLLGGALVAWVLRDPAFRRPGHFLGGVGLGMAVVAMWWVSGHLGFVAEHPQTLDAVYLGTDSGRPESLSFTAPMAYTLDWLIMFSDASNRLSVGVVAVLGVVSGALANSLVSRSFRWEGFRDTQDTALHLVGAVSMGVGGVSALGCTIGQGMSGLSTLSVGSLLAVAGIALGAVLGLRFQIWLIERE